MQFADLKGWSVGGLSCIVSALILEGYLCLYSLACGCIEKKSSQRRVTKIPKFYHILVLSTSLTMSADFVDCILDCPALSCKAGSSHYKQSEDK